MSGERFLIYSAARHQKQFQASQQESPYVPPHSINVVLGGAMVSGMIIMLFIICYCCHKNHSKREGHFSPYWRDQGILATEIFTVDGTQLIEVAEFQIDESNPSTPGPPPSYDSIVNDAAPAYESVVDLEVEELDNEDDQDANRKSRKWSLAPAIVVPLDDSELPSYEEALKLQNGEHI